MQGIFGITVYLSCSWGRKNARLTSLTDSGWLRGISSDNSTLLWHLAPPRPSAGQLRQTWQKSQRQKYITDRFFVVVVLYLSVLPSLCVQSFVFKEWLHRSRHRIDSRGWIQRHRRTKQKKKFNMEVSPSCLLRTNCTFIYFTYIFNVWKESEKKKNKRRIFSLGSMLNSSTDSVHKHTQHTHAHHTCIQNPLNTQDHIFSFVLF